MKMLILFLLCITTIAFAEDMHPNDIGYNVAVKAVEAVSGSVSPCPGFVNNVLLRPEWLCASMPDTAVLDEAVRTVMSAYPREIYYQEGGLNTHVTMTTPYRGRTKKLHFVRYYVPGENEWPSDVEIAILIFADVGKRWIAVSHGTYEGFCWVACD